MCVSQVEYRETWGSQNLRNCHHEESFSSTRDLLFATSRKILRCDEKQIPRLRS